MKKVLVVDDDPEMLVKLESILVKDGYHTEVTADWEVVYKKAREFAPDLILLDMMLAGIDGRFVCRYLKNAYDTKHIPIIMISAYPTAKDTVKAYGADSFIAKPFRINGLLREVKKYIGGKRNK